jgi:hypothetical protein
MADVRELYEGERVMAPLGNKLHRAVVIKVEPTLSLNELRKVQVQFDPPVQVEDEAHHTHPSQHTSLVCKSSRLTKGWAVEE